MASAVSAVAASLECTSPNLGETASFPFPAPFGGPRGPPSPGKLTVIIYETTLSLANTFTSSQIPRLECTSMVGSVRRKQSESPHGQAQAAARSTRALVSPRVIPCPCHPRSVDFELVHMWTLIM